MRDSRDGEEDEADDGSNEESVLTRPVVVDFVRGSVSTSNPINNERVDSQRSIASATRFALVTRETTVQNCPETTNQHEKDEDLDSERGKD